MNSVTITSILEFTALLHPSRYSSTLNLLITSVYFTQHHDYNLQEEPCCPKAGRAIVGSFLPHGKDFFRSHTFWNQSKVLILLCKHRIKQGFILKLSNIGQIEVHTKRSKDNLVNSEYMLLLPTTAWAVIAVVNGSASLHFTSLHLFDQTSSHFMC